jgi:hypothetical protein
MFKLSDGSTEPEKERIAAMFRFARPIVVAALLGALTLVPAAFAGQPVTQTLTPPPPSFETCKAVGNGTICSGTLTESYGPVETDLVCGSGTSAFHVYDMGTNTEHATRYYDRNGNLTRRVRHDDFTSSQFSNPLTGAAVPYHQHETTTDVLAVPGDFGTATTTHTGSLIFTVPHLGAVALEAGRVVEAPDGTIEFRAGPQNFLDYFGNGDTSALQELCSALGAT